MTLLAVEDLHKNYGGISALSGCSFSVERPGIYGVIGPNGAGKTTLFDAITGHVTPGRGRVLLNDADVTGLAPHRLVGLGVARTFQECRVFPEMTCLENLLFAVQRKDMVWTLTRLAMPARPSRAAGDEAMRLLNLVNLQGYADTQAAGLSYGQRRLLEIVAALMLRPLALLLDEPASGVNPALLESLAGFIRRTYEDFPMVFLIVEHNMDFIMRLADDIIVMHQGAVLERGAPARIRRSPQVIEAYLG